MEDFIDKIVANARNINWEGPAAFVAAILAVFAFLRKWSLALLVLLTIALGWGAQDLILFNLNTGNKLISVPFLVYAVGGVSIFFLVLFSFFKSK